MLKTFIRFGQGKCSVIPEITSLKQTNRLISMGQCYLRRFFQVKQKTIFKWAVVVQKAKAITWDFHANKMKLIRLLKMIAKERKKRNEKK